MRTDFLFTSSPSHSSSVQVTWCVGSGRWACLIACGFIHNYGLHLKPKLKYADGAGNLRTASEPVYGDSELSPAHIRTRGIIWYSSLCHYISCWWFTETFRDMKAPVWLTVICSPQAESRRRRDVGQPRSTGSWRRGEDDDAAAAAEAADADAERRRLQRVAVVRERRGSCVNTTRIDRKIQHIWSSHAPPPPPPTPTYSTSLSRQAWCLSDGRGYSWCKAYLETDARSHSHEFFLSTSLSQCFTRGVIISWPIKWRWSPEVSK